MLWARWGKKLNSDLIQVKLGNRRVVCANTFDMVRQLFVKNANQTSGRPNQHLFEHYIGQDLGTSSLTASYKRQRTAGLKSMQPRRWPSYYSMLAREGFEAINALAHDGGFGSKSLVALPLFRKISLNLAFQLTFAKRFDNPEDPWLKEYIGLASDITDVRGSSATWVDFVPLLRWVPGALQDAKKGKRATKRRDEMIADVLVELQGKIDRGDAVDCIASWVLKDKEASLTLDEAVKTCMIMLQGGLDTVAGHLFSGLGALLSPDGLEIQEQAYREIRTVYTTDEEAIEQCFKEEKVPYVTALVKEMLRYYSVVPFSLPRETTTDITIKNGAGADVTLPAHTYVYMNSENANHDPARFGGDAHVFNPSRWIETLEINGPGMPHYAFGAGSRLCPAYQISNRIMYAVMLRIILAFRLLPDAKSPAPTDYQTFGDTPQGLINHPKSFLIQFEPRDVQSLKPMLEAEKQKYQ